MPHLWFGSPPQGALVSRLFGYLGNPIAHHGGCNMAALAMAGLCVIAIPRNMTDLLAVEADGLAS